MLIFVVSRFMNVIKHRYIIIFFAAMIWVKNNYEMRKKLSTSK